MPSARTTSAVLLKTCVTQAARLSVTIGKHLRPAWKLTSRISCAPGLPRTSAQGLPMTDATLGAFKVASKQTGIPASRLLLAALSLTCKGGK